MMVDSISSQEVLHGPIHMSSSIEQSLSWKHTICSLDKKCSCGTLKFITVSTKACHWIEAKINPVQEQILILSSI